MKIVRDSSVLVNTSYHVCTVGYFDGVHLGHQKIIEKLVTDASKNKGKSILVSFWPHPRKVLYPNEHFDYIQSNEDKFKSIEKLGVDVVYLIEFTKEFSKVTAEKFVNDILVNKLQINKLIIGYNHHFGYKREGNFNYLYNLRKNLDFDIEEVKKKEINKLIGKIQREGFTLIPTKMYFKKGKAKIEIAVAKGKKQYDKRQAIKRKDWNRDKARYFRKSS